MVYFLIYRPEVLLKKFGREGGIVLRCASTDHQFAQWQIWLVHGYISGKKHCSVANSRIN